MLRGTRYETASAREVFPGRVSSDGVPDAPWMEVPPWRAGWERRFGESEWPASEGRAHHTRGRYEHVPRVTTREEVVC